MYFTKARWGAPASRRRGAFGALSPAMHYHPNHDAVDITLATPALLFPALSLLMLAYTNRFLGLASLIRSLHKVYVQSQDRALVGQIKNLRRRLGLIRRMQSLGVTSLASCVVCMAFLLVGLELAAKLTFALSLALLLASLGYSLAEILISTEALKIQLAALERDPIIGPNDEL